MLNLDRYSRIGSIKLMDEVEEFCAKGEINVIQGTSFSPGTNATGMDQR